MTRRLLIANRGEVAARIALGAADKGWTAVAVHTADDASGVALRRADETALLPGRGVQGYLDHEALLAVARDTRCDAVHPGWGFLAENAGFAAQCEDAGITLVGPTS